MKTPGQIASDYIAAWNAPHHVERVRLLDGWAEDARYTDPLMNGNGREHIAAMIAGARDRFLGHGFVLRGTPDGHGPFVRFSWTLVSEGGAAAAHGTDVLRLDSDGRISEVIGFLDGDTA